MSEIKWKFNSSFYEFSSDKAGSMILYVYESSEDHKTSFIKSHSFQDKSASEWALHIEFF